MKNSFLHRFCPRKIKFEASRSNWCSNWSGSIIKSPNFLFSTKLKLWLICQTAKSELWSFLWSFSFWFCFCFSTKLKLGSFLYRFLWSFFCRFWFIISFWSKSELWCFFFLRFFSFSFGCEVEFWCLFRFFFLISFLIDF